MENTISDAEYYEQQASEALKKTIDSTRYQQERQFMIATVGSLELLDFFYRFSQEIQIAIIMRRMDSLAIPQFLEFMQTVMRCYFYMDKTTEEGIATRQEEFKRLTDAVLDEINKIKAETEREPKKILFTSSLKNDWNTRPLIF